MHSAPRHAGTSALICAVAAILTFTIHTLSAQAPPTSSTSAPLKKPSPRSHKHPAPPAPVEPPLPATLPMTPVAELPKWPVNDKPGDASVTWDSQGLSINAANSSLQQILNDVSTATGAKVEGLGSDERIFGVYGPGQARDVLSQLLHGSGYNVLMIGDQGQGTPREIVLSTRQTGAAQPSAGNPGNSAEEEPEIDEQPQQPEPQPRPMRPNFGPNNMPRNQGNIPERQPQQPNQQQPNNQPN